MEQQRREYTPPRNFDESFEPIGAMQAGLLRLAEAWRETGALFQCLNAYTEVLERFPGTGAARAAAEDMLSLAAVLEDQGQFHIALDVFDRLDRLL
jgi:hypothetical protein